MEPIFKVGGVKRGSLNFVSSRFTIVLAANDVSTVSCHVHDTGRLIYYIPRGAPIYYVDVYKTGRTTGCDAVATGDPNNMVLLDSRLPNTLFSRLIPLLYESPEHLREVVREFSIKSPISRYRVDFMVLEPGKPPLAVEVKGVNFADSRGIGLFPSAKSHRASRQLDELRMLRNIKVGGVPGFRVSMVFIALRGDISEVRPFRQVDEKFASKLCAYRDIIEYKGYRTRSLLKGSTIQVYYDGEIPVNPCLS
ncbi:MAG: DNA/RNA nuclease SfsA [Acidilobaceae archaeon]